MKNKKETYPIPLRLVNLRIEAESYGILAKIYAKNRNGFRTALKCARKANTLYEIFWFRLYKLNPELNGKSLTMGGRRMWINEK